MNYKFTGAKVFGTDYKFSDRDIYVSNSFFSDSLNEYEELKFDGLYLIPGLTDIHFHGCMGHDFCEGKTETIAIMAKYEESQGITSICPATMTYSEEILKEIMKAAAEYQTDEGAELVGINMEGPFISYEKKGAQNPAYIQKPDIEMFRRLQKEASGLIKLIALAPEVEGADDFISELKNEVVISLAHTNADYDRAIQVFNEGINHVTHLYNAMRPLNHRDPNPYFAAADCDNVEVEIIADGIHVHPAVVRNTLRTLGDDRVIFISDTMEAVGMKDGKYQLGGQAVNKKGNLATLEDGTIAGSATNLMDCMKTAVKKMNIPLETAVKCAAVNPARSIGIYDRYGSLEKGKIANAVALDEDLNIKMVINRGKIVINNI
ncbi:N-acetylglucosamine-6-phosphate deacetylase (plasmid) [Lachnospiraceae bacterium C1.1]|nr:N-acetylglucosamine-6-phosphate deacetylase [Lachnospiraceae bacterium C1.1]